MSRRLLWTLLLGVGLSLAVLIASTHRTTVADLLRYDFASLLVKIALLVFVGGVVLTLFREPFSRALEAALFWVVVALLLVVGYTYRFELREVAQTLDIIGTVDPAAGGTGAYAGRKEETAQTAAVPDGNVNAGGAAEFARLLCAPRLLCSRFRVAERFHARH